MDHINRVEIENEEIKIKEKTLQNKMLFYKKKLEEK